MTKNMLFKVLVTFVCWFGIAYGQEKPDAITINSLTYAGTGCPSNSVRHSVSDDRTKFTIMFDEYIAIMEPGRSVRDNRKYCQINVGLRVPPGWSYTITSIDYRGYMKLEEGTYALKGALYYFSGMPQQSDKLETRWDGPERRDYVISDTFPIDTVVWSACGAPDNLNIKHDIQVAGDPSKIGMITTDTIDGLVSHEYGLNWKTC